MCAPIEKNVTVAFDHAPLDPQQVHVQTQRDGRFDDRNERAQDPDGIRLSSTGGRTSDPPEGRWPM